MNTQDKLRTALSVRDLIGDLEQLDSNAVVVFTCDYGDYHHTQQALPVTSVDRMSHGQKIIDSAYSQSGMALSEPNSEEDDSYCHDCDEEWFNGTAICPKCGATCIDIEGRPMKEVEGDEEAQVVIVLRWL